MDGLAVIILAAGIGKRFKSKIPKVLHNICGKPMFWYVVREAKKLAPQKIVIVGGENYKDEILRYVQNDKKEEMDSMTGGQDIEFAVQPIPKGTGDAVICAEPLFNKFSGYILILCGDTPLIKAETLKKFINYIVGQDMSTHSHYREKIGVLTAKVPNPSMYGRIVREAKNKTKISKIVEDCDATAEEKKITEINSGIYIFEKENLFYALHKIKPNNVQKEYYLTDTIEILSKKGIPVYPYLIDNYYEIIGINTREELREAESIMRKEIIKKHLMAGVTIKDNVIIDFDVQIGKDTIIHEGAQILGNTEIKDGCEIGPNTIIINSKISKNTKIGENSRLENAEI